jgi:hypothetical protein
MPQNPTRRDALRKAAYLAPLMVTLPVVSAFASVGSRSGPTPPVPPRNRRPRRPPRRRAPTT